ncbi:MAG: OmpA family protein, partial [Myxococcota bacterium]
FLVGSRARPAPSRSWIHPRAFCNSLLGLSFAAAGAGLLAGCPSTNGSAFLAERFESDEAEVARDRAPDLFAEAVETRRELDRATGRSDEQTIADLQTTTRLQLDLAITEAQRLGLEEERLTIERGLEAQETELRRLREARFELQDRAVRRAASETAETQARVAFEQAITDERRRYRNRSRERVALHRDAAAVLRRRALLLVAAARAIGATDASLQPVEALVTESEAQRDPHDSMRFADRAVRQAMGALGELRGQRETPSTDQRQALIDAATAVGFETEQRDSGLVVRAPGIFVGNAARISPEGQARIARLATLMDAHPQGPVQLRGFSGTGTPAARLTGAEARAEAAKAILLTEGIDSGRVAVAGVADVEDAAVRNSVEAVFLAFAPVGE